MRLGFLGDMMLGRKVAARLADEPESALFGDEVVAVAGEADLLVGNLECCISERGQRWPDPSKPFFFRAPPAAADALAGLGVDVVTLANNHALDFGRTALLDTLGYLAAAGIAWVGAGVDVERAREPVVQEVGALRLGVVGLADHPPDYAAGEGIPGIAYADVGRSPSSWVVDTIHALTTTVDVVIATPHWGPNMTTEPVAAVRAAGPALVDAGAQVVAGHSAHVFHGVQGHAGGVILFDLGDFIDDYAVDPWLRNDLGLLWLVDVEAGGPVRVEAVPLALDYCHTRLADADEARWIGDRLRRACAALGTEVESRNGRLAVALR